MRKQERSEPTDKYDDTGRDKRGAIVGAIVGAFVGGVVVGVWRSGQCTLGAMKVAILKPGTFTGSTLDGKPATRTYTEEECKRMVTLYNEQPESERKEAPLTLGHPKDNGPAFGWVDRLEYAGGHVWAHMKKLHENFTEWIEKGHYGPVSPSIRSDGSLRHVAALGATPPAIPGLPSWVFGEADEDAFAVDFSADYRVGGIAGILRRIREHIIQKEGLEVADAIVPNDELDALSNEPYDDTQWLREQVARHDEIIKLITNNPSSFAEKHMDNNKPVDGQQPVAEPEKTPAPAVDFSEQLKARDEQIEELKRSNAERDRLIADLQKQNQAADFREFLAPLEAQGIITNANRAMAMRTLETAATQAGEVEFSEGTETKKGSPLDEAKALIRSWPKLVDFSEVATKGRALVENRKSADKSGFEFGERDDVDQDSLKLDLRAKAIMAEKSIEYAEALNIARTEVI